MSDQAAKKNKINVWLGIGLTVGFVTGYKMWRQYKARQNSPLIREKEELWAMVTGASSGIGAAYARRLAEQGYNLILVARRTALLEKLAEEIVGQHQVKVQVLTADLSTSEGVEQVESLITSLTNLNVLVNNAGFGISGQFAENDILVQDNMIHVHVVASVRLTRAALPGMLDQKRGAIVNVSSLAAFFPLSGSATYSATKSYLNAFTEALHQELSGSGVRVQALCPGLTHTGFQTSSGKEFAAVPESLWMVPESVVDRSLRDLGHDRVISVPGIAYRILFFCAPYIPRAWLYTFGRWLTNLDKPNLQFAGFRKRTWGNLGEFANDIGDMIQNREQLHNSVQVLDRNFRRRLMLVVTHVNGCRYCAHFHAKSALSDGMTTEEVGDLLQGIVDRVPETELPALLFALYWAEEGGRSDPEVRQDLVDRYGKENSRAIEAALQMIKIGNYMGNAWDYVLFTISGGHWGNETR